jgi:hypothetical protein
VGGHAGIHVQVAPGVSGGRITHRWVRFLIPTRRDQQLAGTSSRWLFVRYHLHHIHHHLLPPTSLASNLHFCDACTPNPPSTSFSHSALLICIARLQRRVLTNQGTPASWPTTAKPLATRRRTRQRREPMRRGGGAARRRDEAVRRGPTDQDTRSGVGKVTTAMRGWLYRLEAWGRTRPHTIGSHRRSCSVHYCVGGRV